jgi:hypothetical protein
MEFHETLYVHKTTMAIQRFVIFNILPLLIPVLLLSNVWRGIETSDTRCWVLKVYVIVYPRNNMQLFCL